MSHRQKIFIGLAVSAGFCTSLAVYFYVRRRQQRAVSKTPSGDSQGPLPSLLSSFKPRRGRQYDEITSASPIDDAETVRFESGGATIELDIPGGGAPLSPEQATIFTRFLYESINNDEQLHRALISIANAATFKESQINLTNAGCLTRLRELLSIAVSETTKCKVMLALNNLALNEFAITQYSGLVSTVLDLSSTSPSGSPVRLCALRLLVNMCVLDYLHTEYMNYLPELAALVESTLTQDCEALETARILVNLSTNKSNLESLLKMTNLDLKVLVDAFTPSKKQSDDLASKHEDIFLRYLTFYCNIAELIVEELKSGDSNNNNSWLYAPTPQPQNALYFQLFDHDKQISAKVVLRPQWSSPAVNAAVKRLRHAMDTIRQTQFETSVSSIHDEFNQNDHPIVTDTSTPKKSSAASAAAIDNDAENLLDSFTRETNEEFDTDENTTVAIEPSPSEQSLSSFRSAYSTNDNSSIISPEKTISA